MRVSPRLMLLFAVCELMVLSMMPAVGLAAAGSSDQHGRKLRMLVTAYCPCTKCCGPMAAGRTASGASVEANGRHFVAADTSVLPFHTRVEIPGYNAGRAVPVLDRGGAIKGHHLDVYFPSHRQALKWGSRWLDVTISQ